MWSTRLLSALNPYDLGDPCSRGGLILTTDAQSRKIPNFIKMAGYFFSSFICCILNNIVIKQNFV